jgi:UDP:flavonoid glycosyltransferase YjiC (YdhE family)
MATIAFLIEHEEGHLNPTFRLARRLAAREHRVVYLGLADGGDFVRAQGFEFFPILEDVFPRGTLHTLRELILCPADFELPGKSWESEPEVYYVEPTVDLERRAEGAFPWEELDPARRLVYVSLGSQSHRAGAERVKAFLHAAAAGFAERPDWQVVISTGGLLEPGEIATSSGGIVTGWAPQLDLLDRAAVMVTHGGMGTVKECIVRGVPMVVFPIDHDQPDNARRVVHHNLGVSGDLRSATAGEIVALVEQADRPAVRESMAKMRQRFLDVEGSGIGVRRIEELLEAEL